MSIRPFKTFTRLSAMPPSANRTCSVCKARPAVLCFAEMFGRTVVNVAYACTQCEAPYTCWEILSHGDNPSWGTRDRKLN